jgi:ATP-binding cassette subfamily B protein
VVYALTSGQGLSYYLTVIIGLTLITLIVESLKYWSLIMYTFENIYTRNTQFFLYLSDHQLESDYQNIEPKSKRRSISKAFEAVASNIFGIELMLRNVPLLLINITGMIFYGGLVAIYVPIVLVVLLTMTVVNFLLTRKANTYMESRRDDINNQYEQKDYLTIDVPNPNYGKDIRLYKLKDWFNNILIGLTKKRVIIAKKIERRYIFANVSNSIFLLARDFIVFSLLISLVLKGDIDITTFTFLTGTVAAFTLWLNGFVQASNNLRTSTISVKEYRKCLDTENQLNHGEGRDISKLEIPLSIEFKNVSFTYPDTDKVIIENLSFKIDPGEKVALVGDNGAGKTTIIKLLTGLYIADEGEILINGYDIHSFNINDYMSLLSVVFQDSEPLSLTIENIITCQRNKEVDKERLYDALEKSGLKEKVLSLEAKENTYITQIFDLTGIRLSGGEIQKLMLARALYKNAPLLILDEPTAALDPLAEERMYLQYDKLTEHNTSLFISHRLASTKFCDRVFFLENGKIIENGSHDELIALNKKYKETFNIQAKYYKEDHDE